MVGQEGDVEKGKHQAAQKRDDNYAILSSYRLGFRVAGGHLSYADRLRSDTEARSAGVVCADWIALLEVGQWEERLNCRQRGRRLCTVDAP